MTVREKLNAITKEIDVQPRTNADRIRKMTDRELAEWLDSEASYTCNICARQNEKGSCTDYVCIEYVEKWLKQEVDNG